MGHHPLLTLEVALKVAQLVVEIAKKDGDKPIAVTIVGNDFQRIVTLAMDHVKPISVQHSYRKAYTALMTQGDTVLLEENKRDPASFGDHNMTCVAGGILISMPAQESDGSRVVGAIGVSGRRSQGTIVPAQDHELAGLGVDFFYEVIRTKS